MARKARKAKKSQPSKKNTKQAQDTQHVLPKLSMRRLKKSIIKKYAAQYSNYSKKHQKYYERIEQGSISAIIEQNRFGCPICLQILVKPTLMQCGHVYCQQCLQSYIANHLSCALCRSQYEQNSFIPSSFAQRMISDFVISKPHELFSYLCRTTDTQEWIQRRKVKELKRGLIVDFQDQYNIWRKGIVSEVYCKKDGELMVQVLYAFKGQKAHENVKADSRRLAPVNFFTKSRYLECFAPNLPEKSIKDELQYLEYHSDRNEQDIFHFQPNDLDIDHQAQPLPRQDTQESVVDYALALFNWQMGYGQSFI